MSSLQYLIYLSTPSVDLAIDDIHMIGKVSIKKNDIRGITGLLLMLDGYFLQYIEGAPKVVEKLMLKISGDPRHDKVMVISSGKIEERLFPLWNMCTNEELLKKAILSMHDEVKKDDEHFMAISILAGMIRSQGYLADLKPSE
jgi:hypothetical protein